MARQAWLDEILAMAGAATTASCAGLFQQFRKRRMKRPIRW